MKKRGFWWFILAVGILPFVAPFIGFAYEMINSSSWMLVDWLVFYSFVYWPTYIIGVLLIAISAIKLIK